MEKLSQREFHDISVHACEKMVRGLNDAFQLMPDPEQRSAMACQVAEAMVQAAADFTIVAFEARSGHKVSRHLALLSLIKQILEHHGIEVMERD